MLFIGMALSFWIAPAHTAALFGIAAAGPQGVVSICADLGGLFLGMGSLVGFGAVRRTRGPLLAAATMLGAIAAGRVVGWIAHVGSPLGGRELLVEVGTMVALLMLAGRSKSARMTG